MVSPTPHFGRILGWCILSVPKIVAATVAIATMCFEAGGANADSVSDPEVVVYGATPGGVASAVRLAREGVPVLLVSPYENLGGLLSNGLTTMDTLYSGARAPLYDEFRQSIYDYYRKTYGENSPQYKATEPGRAKTKSEARVMELLTNQMLAAEPLITVRKGYYPVSAVREGRCVKEVVFQKMDGDETFTVPAYAFVDASYEGDLAAIADVPYRLGRESRDEFNEEHAGRIFMEMAKWPPEHVDPKQLEDYRKLKLIHYNRWLDIIPTVSTGESDRAVQGYNLRTVLTNDPANRIPIEKPPGYDREAFLLRLDREIKWRPKAPEINQPNNKTYMNMPELIGLQHAWPEGTWKERRRIREEHAHATLSMIYFLQNDPSLSEELRERWREWGLPKDEFADNGHLPYEIYVREARRIKGRSIFTENDARLSAHHKRAPINEDAISITEWFMDSHPCTPEKVKGSLWEGEFLLNNISYPGQIPLGTMFPENLDNFLVPVCASTTHVGWGAIRLEPTWMSMAEAAALAIVLAKQAGTDPANVDADALQRLAAERRFMLTFFNDAKDQEREPWYPAVQYLGTKGFFGSYDALPNEPLTHQLAVEWARAAAEIVRGEGDANQRAARALEAEKAAGPTVTSRDFLKLLADALARPETDLEPSASKLDLALDAPILRSDACRIAFEILINRAATSVPAQRPQN